MFIFLSLLITSSLVGLFYKARDHLASKYGRDPSKEAIALLQEVEDYATTKGILAEDLKEISNMLETLANNSETGLYIESYLTDYRQGVGIGVKDLGKFNEIALVSRLNAIDSKKHVLLLSDNQKTRLKQLKRIY